MFHVTAVTHRRDPIYFTTVVGIPPMEDEWLGLATERIFAPLLRTQWPEVTEMHLPPAGVFHNLVSARRWTSSTPCRPGGSSRGCGARAR